MNTSDFDYHLPPELIAQQPLADRTASRMMVVNRATGEIRHDLFRNLSRHLHAGDLLVLNDTKVIPARIWSRKPVVELLLVEKIGSNRWTTLLKPGNHTPTQRGFFGWFNRNFDRANRGYRGSVSHILRRTGWRCGVCC